MAIRKRDRLRLVDVLEADGVEPHRPTVNLIEVLPWSEEIQEALDRGYSVSAIWMHLKRYGQVTQGRTAFATSCRTLGLRQLQERVQRSHRVSNAAGYPPAERKNRGE